jgi:hypothetical protein
VCPADSASMLLKCLSEFSSDSGPDRGPNGPKREYGVRRSHPELLSRAFSDKNSLYVSTISFKIDRFSFTFPVSNP